MTQTTTTQPAWVKHSNGCVAPNGEQVCYGSVETMVATSTQKCQDGSGSVMQYGHDTVVRATSRCGACGFCGVQPMEEVLPKTEIDNDQEVIVSGKWLNALIERSRSAEARINSNPILDELHRATALLEFAELQAYIEGSYRILKEEPQGKYL